VHGRRRVRARDERRRSSCAEPGRSSSAVHREAAATGQDVTAEELGGADVHTRRSASPILTTSDEHDCPRSGIVRTCTAFGRNPVGPAPPGRRRSIRSELTAHPRGFRSRPTSRLVARIVDGSLPRVQGALRRNPRHRFAHRRHRSGSANNGVLAESAQRRALHRALLQAAVHSCFPEHHWLHGGSRIRGRRDLATARSS
jgi:hypothetical protein